MPIERALRRHGPLNARSAGIATRDFIVVAPQLPRGGDIWHRYADEVRAAIDQACAQHAADRARRYLTGFSYGGNGVFDLASAQPDFWAALWAVDPTRVPREAPGPPLWLSAGDAARPQKAAFVRALALGKADRRVWDDTGKDHVGSARVAYADERIYRWLLRQVR
jgi:predicted peptidase